MASEWLVVISTGIGAGIGGAVGLASLWIRGRQDAAAQQQAAARDDRLRSEDRAWHVRHRNLEERRDTYTEMLRTGLVCLRGFRWFVDFIDDASEEELQEARVTTEAAIHELVTLAAAVEVVAVDRTLLSLVHDIVRVTGVALDSLENADWPSVTEPAREFEQLYSSLGQAIRRDLDLEAHET